MKLTRAASAGPSTWRGPGCGVARSASCITSGPPCFSTRMAFMVAFLAARGPDVKRTESLSARPIPRYSAHPPPPRKDAYEDGRPETPRSLRPSPHRPRRLRRREDDRGPRPPLLGRADRPHGPAIDPPAAAARSAAEAMAMVRAVGGNGNANGFFVAQDCHPQTIAVLKTRAAPLGIELIVGDPDSFDFQRPIFGALLQYPATDGRVRDPRAFIEKVHRHGALAVLPADLLPLPPLPPPGGPAPAPA